MTYEMHNNQTRTEEFSVATLEEGLNQVLKSNGKYSLVIDNLKKDDYPEETIDSNSLLTTYIPKTKSLGNIRISSSFGWKTSLYVDSTYVDGGSYSESIFNEARLWSKDNPDKSVRIEFWAVDGEGLPLDLNQII